MQMELALWHVSSMPINSYIAPPARNELRGPRKIAGRPRSVCILAVMQLRPSFQLGFLFGGLGGAFAKEAPGPMNQSRFFDGSWEAVVTIYASP